MLMPTHLTYSNITWNTIKIYFWYFVWFNTALDSKSGQPLGVAAVRGQVVYPLGKISKLEQDVTITMASCHICGWLI
jgi:hypothetical protein